MKFFNILLPIIQFSFFAKIGFLAVDLLLIVFLIVALKQTFAMNTIINDVNDSPIIKVAAFALFIVAVSLFLTALVIL